MTERDGYEQGVPCWIDHSSDDPASAAAFYGRLFGWDTEDLMPPDAPGRYFAARMRGRDVAGIGSQPAEGTPPVWNTYIAVDDADASAARAARAGGSVLSEPFDVMDAGRMAVLADPAGAVFSVWQAGNHRGAGLVDEPGTLAWNELTTRDVQSSERFYNELFGWRPAEMSFGLGQYVTWHLPGDEPPDPERNAIGGMMPMVGDQWPDDLSSHWMTYFDVQDTDATASRARELGATVTVPPFDTPAGRIAVIADPLGATFSVIQMPTGSTG
jgi:predicted enzyme related to lactoylglutathione lyase